MKKALTGMLLCTAVIGLIFTGCGKQDKEAPVEENAAEEMESGAAQTPENPENTDISDYELYSGRWALDGASHEQILESGGAEMSCTIRKGNEFSGDIYTQQGGTERFASIEDITGKIEDSELLFEFADDGWGGTGKLHISFLPDQIEIEVLDYRMAEENRSGYGISGTYEMIRVTGEKDEKAKINQSAEDELSYDEIWTEFYEKYYGGASQEEIEKKLNERTAYYHASGYYGEIQYYWENIRGVRDISNHMEPLYFTDMKYYTEEDFQDVPSLVIHLAKNEIYARHGYIFEDADLYNYFMGCIWYEPSVSSDEFDDGVFNDYERKNLELLALLDSTADAACNM